MIFEINKENTGKMDQIKHKDTHGFGQIPSSLHPLETSQITTFSCPLSLIL